MSENTDILLFVGKVTCGVNRVRLMQEFFSSTFAILVEGLRRVHGNRWVVPCNGKVRSERFSFGIADVWSTLELCIGGKKLDQHFLVTDLWLYFLVFILLCCIQRSP